MTETIYKWLTADNQSPVAGNWTWTPGEWREHKGKLVPCQSGIHACRPCDLVHHIAARLWIAEADGDRVDVADKIVVRRLRIVAPVETITDQTLRLFAADCAADELTLFERDRQNDDRPRRAIQAARDFAHGRITAAAVDAAWDAARAAAWAAARAAAWAAAWARYNARLLQYMEHGVEAEHMPWGTP